MLLLVRPQLPGININITAKKEHVADVERMIQTLKERFRAIYSTLSFKHLTAKIITQLTTLYVLWLNAFPPKGGVSKTLSPRTSTTGMHIKRKYWTEYPMSASVIKRVKVLAKCDRQPRTITFANLHVDPFGDSIIDPYSAGIAGVDNIGGVPLLPDNNQFEAL